MAGGTLRCEGPQEVGGQIIGRRHRCRDRPAPALLRIQCSLVLLSLPVSQAGTPLPASPHPQLEQEGVGLLSGVDSKAQSPLLPPSTVCPAQRGAGRFSKRYQHGQAVVWGALLPAGLDLGTGSPARLKGLPRGTCSLRPGGGGGEDIALTPG